MLGAGPVEIPENPESRFSGRHLSDISTELYPSDGAVQASVFHEMVCWLVLLVCCRVPLLFVSEPHTLQADQIAKV